MFTSYVFDLFKLCRRACRSCSVMSSSGSLWCTRLEWKVQFVWRTGTTQSVDPHINVPSGIYIGTVGSEARLPTVTEPSSCQICNGSQQHSCAKFVYLSCRPDYFSFVLDKTLCTSDMRTSYKVIKYTYTHSTPLSPSLQSGFKKNE